MRAYLEAQGSLILLKVLDAKKRPFSGVSKRGRIKSFSAQSRRRILRFMARIRAGGYRATFITLTFKGYPTNARAKMVLRRFTMRLSRFAPKASFVWRMEYQTRGAIHFHLLCFGLPYWEQKEVQEAWQACTEEDYSRVDIRLVKSKRGVMHYVSKYIAKRSKAKPSTSLVSVPYLHGRRKWRKGRFWGYHNKERLPLGQKYTGVLLKSDLIKRFSRAAWEIIGYETKFNSISFHLFSDSAVALFRRYIDAGGLDADEWRWSTQLTPQEHDDYAYQHSHFSQADYDLDYERAKPCVSRPRSAGTVQPCTREWLAQSSFVSRTAVDLP